MDYQCWEVQEPDRDRWFVNVEEIFGECDLMHKELKLEEVLASGSGHLSCRHYSKTIITADLNNLSTT